MTKADFKTIFDKYFDSVRNYIYYRSGDTELATDITQDTFMKLWEKNIDPSKLNNIGGLIFKIARDGFVSNYRKELVSSNFKLSIADNIVSQTPEETLQFEELKKRYEISLNKLPEKQRVVFLMSRIDKLKYHEIAEITGITIKGVEKRMQMALAFLRKELEY